MSDLSDDDKKQWQKALQDVTPLKAVRKINTKPPPKPIRKVFTPIESEFKPHQIFYDNDEAQPESIFFARSGLQHRVQQQLRQGKIKPQATLDLHGFTVEEARVAVHDFLIHAQQLKLKVIKIIHGKGAMRGAILRGKVYQWLPQSYQVLAFCSAIASEGGTGAVYVLLRV